MKVEWLYEARNEYRDILQYYKTQVGHKYARAFAEKVIGGVRQLEKFPESGVLRSETLIGKYGFRALFIDHYVCVYKIEWETVYICLLTDARRNYIYQIFGFEQ
jgi:plasmid stabilization system protein ParE